MELSGHSPFIVFDDVDINKALIWQLLLNSEIMVKFVFQGVIFIESKDEFANLMVKKTKKLKLGNGMDKDTLLGPLCTKEIKKKLVEITKKRVEKFF